MRSCWARAASWCPTARRTPPPPRCTTSRRKTKLADYAPPFAMADSTVWKVTEPGHLDGKDLTTGVVKTVLVASACTVGPDRVNGRWALLSGCNQVVDVKGPEAPRNLTVAADAQLGNGFTVQASGSDLLVTDLNDQSLGQRRYGPIRPLPPASVLTALALPRSCTPMPTAEPRVISLSWLTADPQQRPDTVAPVLTSASAGARDPGQHEPVVRVGLHRPTGPELARDRRQLVRPAHPAAPQPDLAVRRLEPGAVVAGAQDDGRQLQRPDRDRHVLAGAGARLCGQRERVECVVLQ